MDSTVHEALAALAEPNRFRIVELLAVAPRTVGEIAVELGLRQPQATKHVQILERAGLVEAYRLGRRRVCGLRRPTLARLAGWAEGIAVPGPDDVALARYGAAVATADTGPVVTRRIVGATPDLVWRAFTDPSFARRWWHPRHFTVEAFIFQARVDGAVELVLREGSGDTHHARGQVRTWEPPKHLRFTLDPLDAGGQPLFTADHDLHLNPTAAGTAVDLIVTPSDLRPGAEAALGGLEIGWEQLFDHLETLVHTLAVTTANDQPAG